MHITPRVARASIGVLVVVSTALILTGCFSAMRAPDLSWIGEYERFYGLNGLARSAGWSPLREVTLAADEVEIRLWILGSYAGVDVLALRKTAGHWSAEHAAWPILPSTDPAAGRVQQAAVEPACWEPLLAELWRLKLKELPDESQLPLEGVVTDGQSYVVEVAEHGGYRTYHYHGPEVRTWPDAHRMTQILFTLHRELNFPRPFPFEGTLPVKAKDGQVILLKRGSAVGAVQFFDQRAGGGHNDIRARWAYRADGQTFLSGSAVQRGDAAITGVLRFGTFVIGWHSGGQLSISGPGDEPPGRPERIFVAATSLTDLDGIDVSSHDWTFTRVPFYIEPMPCPRHPRAK